MHPPRAASRRASALPLGHFPPTAGQIQVASPAAAAGAGIGDGPLPGWVAQPGKPLGHPLHTAGPLQAASPTAGAGAGASAGCVSKFSLSAAIPAEGTVAGMGALQAGRGLSQGHVRARGGGTELSAAGSQRDKTQGQWMHAVKAEGLTNRPGISWTELDSAHYFVVMLCKGIKLHPCCAGAQSSSPRSDGLTKQKHMLPDLEGLPSSAVGRRT
eukprot:1161201-Pelagomonas_calceolata.AAC.12